MSTVSSVAQGERDVLQTELRAMKRITIEALEQALSNIVQSIERGESFLVTRRGRAVACMVPHDQPEHRDPRVHTGSRFGARGRLEPLGSRATGGRYLAILRDDRQGGER